jgi:two-component system nitrogen regulation response regulator NtrX
MMARILVIDDEEAVRFTVKEVLVRAGYDVDTASDGKEGLEILRDSGADLVITDIIMPGIDGVAVLNHVRAEYENTPVIVISGGGNIAPMEYEPSAIKTNAYLASAAIAGADATLTKPFDRKALLGTVEDLLGN